MSFVNPHREASGDRRDPSASRCTAPCWAVSTPSRALPSLPGCLDPHPALQMKKLEVRTGVGQPPAPRQPAPSRTCAVEVVLAVGEVLQESDALRLVVVASGRLQQHDLRAAGTGVGRGVRTPCGPLSPRSLRSWPEWGLTPPGSRLVPLAPPRPRSTQQPAVLALDAPSPPRPPVSARTAPSPQDALPRCFGGTGEGISGGLTHGRMPRT